MILPSAASMSRLPMSRNTFWATASQRNSTSPRIHIFRPPQNPSSFANSSTRRDRSACLGQPGGTYLSLGAGGLAMQGGNGIDGDTVLTWIDPLRWVAHCCWRPGVTLSPGSTGILAGFFVGLRPCPDARQAFRLGRSRAPVRLHCSLLFKVRQTAQLIRSIRQPIYAARSRSLPRDRKSPAFIAPVATTECLRRPSARAR